MTTDQVENNLHGMDELDFIGWNNADWNGVFAHHHTDDVLVGWKDPIRFGSGEWTCVVGEFEGGGRMVTVARWRDGPIAEEYIWS